MRATNCAELSPPFASGGGRSHQCAGAAAADGGGQADVCELGAKPLGLFLFMPLQGGADTAEAIAEGDFESVLSGLHADVEEGVELLRRDREGADTPTPAGFGLKGHALLRRLRRFCVEA